MSKLQSNQDRELAVILTITRSLPAIRGSGVVVNRMFKPFYCRKTRPLVWADVDGFQMYLDPKECVDGALLFMPHLYDRHELHYLRKNLKSGDTFVDVGANIGIYALVASRVVGQAGTVIAIEADPENFQKLKLNVNQNKITAITACQVGVSDRDETLSLKINTTGNRGGNSFVSSESRESVGVKCKPLIEILRQHDVGQLQGIKLDIEGFEYKVLQAFFHDADTAQYPKFVIIEVNPAYSDYGSPVDLLKANGYRVAFDYGLNVIMERE